MATRKVKAQLSFEFLVYIAVSAVSLAFALLIFSNGIAEINNVSNRAFVQQFVSSVNSNMWYGQSRFAAYLPGAICNAVVSNQNITYQNTTYYFDGNISTAGSGLCPYSNRIIVYNMTRLYNGTYLIMG